MIQSVVQQFLDAFVAVQGWLLDKLVQPPLLALGLGSYIELAFDGVEIFMWGVLQLLVALLVLRPLETLRPLEHWKDRKLVRVDVLYTLLDRLGIIPLVVFALIAPIFVEIEGWLRFRGYIPPQLEDLFPALEHVPLLGFFVYLVALDFAEYWRHRLSHTFGWWWALHAIHHSQRQMSLWTDSRNHLLDDVISGLWFAIVALLIGIPPGHFIGLMLVVKLVENLSHINARLSYGRLGERLVVSPHYHRWHHSLALPPGRNFRHGCNFAILFPVWDWLFGTLYLARDNPPTGIAPHTVPGTPDHDGFWRQQWDGLRGMWLALFGPRRPQP